MTLAKPTAPNFDAEQHRYTDNDGAELAGVTTVLKTMGLYQVPPQAKEYHRSRGSAIHDGTVAVDQDNWNRKTTSEVIVPYIEAYEKFTLDFGFHATHIEKAVCSSRYHLAGTLDRIGRINNPASRDVDKTVLIDIKAYEPPPSVEIQMALYKFMAQEQFGVKIDACWALWLKDTGQYKVIRSTDPSALQLGLAAVSLYHWRRNHGLLGA